MKSSHMCTAVFRTCFLVYQQIQASLVMRSRELILLTYRIIPNKRAGRGDKVGGAFIMCNKMLICISRAVVC